MKNKRTFHALDIGGYRSPRSNPKWNIEDMVLTRGPLHIWRALGRRWRLRGGEKANRFNRRTPNTAHLRRSTLDLILTDVESAPCPREFASIRMLNARDIDDNDAKAANWYSSKIEVENEERKRREGREDEKSFHQREGKRGGKKIEFFSRLNSRGRYCDRV